MPVAGAGARPLAGTTPKLDKKVDDSTGGKGGKGAAVEQAGTYTVKKGDTLQNIAKAHSTTVSVLAKLNGIANPDKIGVGLKLKLPESAFVGSSGTAPAKNLQELTRGSEGQRMMRDALQRAFPDLDVVKGFQASPFEWKITGTDVTDFEQEVKVSGNTVTLRDLDGSGLGASATVDAATPKALDKALGKLVESYDAAKGKMGSAAQQFLFSHQDLVKKELSKLPGGPWSVEDYSHGSWTMTSKQMGDVTADLSVADHQLTLTGGNSGLSASAPLAKPDAAGFKAALKELQKRFDKVHDDERNIGLHDDDPNIGAGSAGAADGVVGISTTKTEKEANKIAKALGLGKATDMDAAMGGRLAFGYEKGMVLAQNGVVEAVRLHDSVLNEDADVPVKIIREAMAKKMGAFDGIYPHKNDSERYMFAKGEVIVSQGEILSSPMYAPVG